VRVSKPCATCAGRGWRELPDDGSAPYPWRAGRVSCADCAGTGREPEPEPGDVSDCERCVGHAARAPGFRCLCAAVRPPLDGLDVADVLDALARERFSRY
jgi:hypothetical protein